ncbi:ThuA domain-containing protein [Salinimicrobium sp. CDJ15-81-2]|nr:ThuA domain-containing protein [Salinimicrobium nanhaiense]
MKKITIIPFLLVIFLSCNEQKKDRILIFTKTAGFVHESIPDGKAAIMRAGQEMGIEVDTTSDASYFGKEKLENYKAVVFLNTTGDVLKKEQQNAFEDYIRSGGGFAGIHSAADTEYEWPWYGKLVGGYFKSHPHIQEAVVKVINTDHPSTKHLPKHWTRRDEWYNYKNLNPEVTVLAQLDEQTYEGGENGSHHPIAWHHSYEGGRAFYTGGGHTSESYIEPDFLQHVMKGIIWAGDLQKVMD